MWQKRWFLEKKQHKKIIKDPVHGYIEIDSDIIKNFIDTPEFQRLRNIIQTSYTPLYPSSLDNRFVHSIGVYYLGGLATASIEESFNKPPKDWIKLKKLFLFACLFHDIGHAPFSHTGEEFYRLQYGKDLDKMLCDIVGDPEFTKDEDEYKTKAAPHEIMSCIIALESFGKKICKNSKEKSFFVRCITGYQYRDKNQENSLKNCLIQLLNSKSIDVDRLDYIMRDAETMGYKSARIDVERLMKGISIAENHDAIGGTAEYEVVFDKNSISVIENVIYARDAEKKWIQTQPVIVYENFLLEQLMAQISLEFPDLFTKEALTENGVEIIGKTTQFKCRIRLLADEDMIFLFKNVLPENQIIDEYFNRGSRRSPLWKSEAEYTMLFGGGTLKTNNAEKKFSVLSSLTTLQNASSEGARLPYNIGDELLSEFKDNADKYQQDAIKLMAEQFKHLADESGVEFDFVVLFPKKFGSAFAEDEVGNIKIFFPVTGDIEYFRNVTQVLSAEKKNSAAIGKMFYIFYRDATNKTRKIMVQILKKLFNV